VIEDNSVRDRGSTVVNLRGAHKPGRRQFFGEAINPVSIRDKDTAYFYEPFIPAFDPVAVEGRLSLTFSELCIGKGLAPQSGRERSMLSGRPNGGFRQLSA
jgi:hypothetical protein